MVLLLVGKRIFIEFSISILYLVIVFWFKGICIVIWFLLKLVLNVEYINGCNWIVLLLISFGWNV